MTVTYADTRVDDADSPDGAGRFHIVIAGGGVAGLETALALSDLAGDRVRLTILSPDADLVYRPLSVREPFAHAPARRYPLATIARDVGATLVTEGLARVDAERRTAHDTAGRAYSYDALVIAAGARAVPRYSHAMTVDDRHMDETLLGLIQDVEGGHVRRVAFVVPPRMAWLLPIYELALMTAQRAWDMNVKLDVHLITPEDAPLTIFGRGASTGVSRLLTDAGVHVVCDAYVQVPHTGQIVITPGDRRLEVDRIVALPELYGPSLPGLPLAENGFLAVDPYGKVRGVERVYAAGDVTDFAVKHGGIAAQQAGIAARSIAALAGATIRPRRFRPTIRGLLLTGSSPKYLTACITGGMGFTSQISDTPSWSPPGKIAAKYLAPYLAERDTPERAVRVRSAPKADVATGR